MGRVGVRRFPCWLAGAAALLVAAAAWAQADAGVMLHNRRIVEFRAMLGGDTSAQRAEAAEAALRDAAAGPGVVRAVAQDPLMRFEIDGRTMFYLGLGDLPGRPDAADLAAAARKVEARLTQALAESRELRDPRAWAVAAGHAVAASALAGAAMWLLAWLHRQLRGRLLVGARAAAGSDPMAPWRRHGARTLALLASALVLGLALLVVDFWVSYVLQRFAWTRPWGEASTRWLLDLLAGFAVGAASAVPGLLAAAMVFLLARLLVGLLAAFLAPVERGSMHLGWLDADTAGPTRRIGATVIWLFALAIAYPSLPGAGSEALKGVTVLAGLMLSLGASGVVGQAIAGLTLVYARALRVGEYVKVGDTEGTVAQLGLFVTKLHTGMGEEINLPNAHVMSQPIRNFSRLTAEGQYVLHTAVTIGYAVPWRQVHALLLEAARRTTGVAQQPAPHVIQTALSDFYVEYRLCAQASRAAPLRRAQAMSELHGHIQDVFNDHGVQIMSPHYMSDPAQPQVVPPGAWSPPSGAPLVPPGQG